MQEKTGFAKQMKFGLLQNVFKIRKQKKLEQTYTIWDTIPLHHLGL